MERPQIGGLVLAVDTTHKPNEIPDSCWLVDDEIYTVEKLLYNPITDVWSLQLKELRLPAPYKGFNINRFVIL